MLPAPSTPTVMSRRSLPRTSPPWRPGCRRADDLGGTANRHQDQHEREVRDAVAARTHVLDRDPKFCRGIQVDVIETDAPVEMYSTPAALSARSSRPLSSDVWPTLMHRLPGTEMTPVCDTASHVVVATSPTRGLAHRTARFVRLAAVHGESDGCGVRHACAGPWEGHVSSQDRMVLPARLCDFRYADERSPPPRSMRSPRGVRIGLPDAVRCEEPGIGIVTHRAPDGRGG